MKSSISAYSTDDSYLVERELVEGQVVQSSETEITGDFDTTATVTSTTETAVDGTYHAEIEPYYGPGPVSLGSMEADETFSDERTTSSTMTMSQSGSYGHGENDSSASSLSVTAADEYFSRIDGEMYWSDGYVDTDAEWWYEESGSSEKTFSQSESYTPLGNSASWSTSLEREREWEVHSTTTLFAYATDADDSGSESYSESSGGQSYTPNEEDNPSHHYDGSLLGGYGGVSGGGEGEGEGGEEGNGRLEQAYADRLDAVMRSFKQFLTPKWQGKPWVNLPHVMNPGDELLPKTNDLVMRWKNGEPPREELVLTSTGGEESAPSWSDGGVLFLLKMFGGKFSSLFQPGLGMTFGRLPNETTTWGWRWWYGDTYYPSSPKIVTERAGGDGTMAGHLTGITIYFPDNWTDEQIAAWLLAQMADASSPIHEWALTMLATHPEFADLHRSAAISKLVEAAREAKGYLETVVSTAFGPGGSVIMITHFVGEGRYGAAALEGVGLIPIGKIFGYLAGAGLAGTIIYKLSITKGVALDFSVGMLAPLFKHWNASQIDGFFGGLIAATAKAKTHDEAVDLARKYFRDKLGPNGDLWFDMAYSAVRNPNWRQSAYDSEALRRALGLVKGDGYFAHHIVAGRIAEAAEARRLLDYYQIGINSHYNGVALTFPEHYLTGLHSPENMRRISRRLERAVRGITDWNLARQRLIAELEKIRIEILTGQFP